MTDLLATLSGSVILFRDEGTSENYRKRVKKGIVRCKG